MESLISTKMEIDDNPDLGELYILVNTDKPKAAVSWLVDDERNFYLRRDPETGQVVGAVNVFAEQLKDEVRASADDAIQRDAPETAPTTTAE
jgi:hypothetical protein